MIQRGERGHVKRPGGKRNVGKCIMWKIKNATERILVQHNLSNLVTEIRCHVLNSKFDFEKKKSI